MNAFIFRGPCGSRGPQILPRRSQRFSQRSPKSAARDSSSESEPPPGRVGLRKGHGGWRGDIYVRIYFKIFTCHHQLEGEERPPTWLVVVVLVSRLDGARQEGRRGRRLVGVRTCVRDSRMERASRMKSAGPAYVRTTLGVILGLSSGSLGAVLWFSRRLSVVYQ